AGEPDRVDRRILNHRGDRGIRLRVADAELLGDARCRRRIRRVGTPHAKYVRITNADESLQVELGVEAAAHHSDAESFRHSILVLDTEFLQGLRRAAGPLAHERVASIVEVGYADLAGVETGGRQIPKSVEEGDTLTELGFCFLRPRDVVHQGGALGVGALDEGLARPRVTLG